MSKNEIYKFTRLLKHVGHHIEYKKYNNEETGEETLEFQCNDCREFLFEIDKPEGFDEAIKYNFQWTMNVENYKKLKTYQETPEKLTSMSEDYFGAVYCNQLCVEFFHTCDLHNWHAYHFGFEYSPNIEHPRFSHKSKECLELNDVYNTDHIDAEKLLRETSNFEEFKKKVEEKLSSLFEIDEELFIKATTEVPEKDKDIFFIKPEENEQAEKNEQLKTLELPDGKKIICPAEINMSELTDFDDLEYELWHTIESYLDRMEIRTEDDDPDWATVKEVQTTILNILERSGVNINV